MCADVRKGKRVTIQCDVHYLPFRDRCFGFVWASELLEHLDNQQQALDEIDRVSLKAVVTYPTPKNPSFYVDPSHRPVNLNSYRNFKKLDRFTDIVLQK